MNRSVVIALSLRIDGADGKMTHWITTILSEPRLYAILGEQGVPAGWTKGVYDRSWRRLGLGRLAALDPKPAVVRYERETPGELIHLDMRKLGRIARPSHRVTGNR